MKKNNNAFVKVDRRIAASKYISKNAKLLYQTLGLYNPCYPGYKLLTEIMQCSRSSVKLAIDELVQRKIMTYVKGRAKGYSNFYTISISKQTNFGPMLNPKRKPSKARSTGTLVATTLKTPKNRQLVPPVDTNYLNRNRIKGWRPPQASQPAFKTKNAAIEAGRALVGPPAGPLRMAHKGIEDVHTTDGANQSTEIDVQAILTAIRIDFDRDNAAELRKYSRPNAKLR